MATALPSLAAAARLRHEPSIDRLRQLALTAEDPQHSRRAVKALKKVREHIRFEDLKHAVLTDAQVHERGLTRFVPDYPPTKIARMIALMSANNVALDEVTLWALAGRKRNRGLFRPSAEDVDSLNEETAGRSDLRAKVFDVLGVRL